MKHLHAALLVAGFAFMSTTASATDFLLHNETGHVIKSFTTKERKGGWSANWIKGKGIKPGETWHMEFTKDGDCVVRVNVKSDDGYVHDYDINFCKATEIFIMVDSIEYH